MQVDLNQWRAAIGSFRSQLIITVKRSYKTHPLSTLASVLGMYLFCSLFINIAIPLLPLTTILYTIITPFHLGSNWMHIFARLYATAKLFFCVLSKLMKRFPLACHDRRKKLTSFITGYAYLYMICLTSHTLYLQWITYKILLCGDIETNPGPINDTISFCSWNLNSICAHDFARISLIEAYNSVYEYDLIGIVETHLDSSVEESKIELDGYNFMKTNHPLDVKRGGVGLYVKDTFPAKERPDLETLPECIVCEFQLDRKKYFFVVLYRSPSQSQNEFQVFMNNFELMLSKMSDENPYCVIVTGDLNCRSSHWWENDIDNEEGKLFEPFSSDLGLHQLISEPTHFIGNSRSCIDVILTDQPNLFLESGVHPSLHKQCHHQIIYGKLSIKNPAPPPYQRKIWFYDRADILAIKKSIDMFPWRETFRENSCPNWQVKKLNEILLNICSNFIPNKVITVRPRQAPWITQSIKNFLKKRIELIRLLLEMVNQKTSCRISQT